jgi:sterol desaturase/sphingolipid hydroxylase (fatty acid hydroxylase superfamily)
LEVSNMSLDDLVGVTLVGCFFLILIAELLFPARAYPKRRLWRLRGFGFLVLIAALSGGLPLLLQSEWLAQHRLIDGAALGTAGGVLVGYAAVSFVSYVWHRSTHRLGFLWRGFHQLHHAPQRLDIASSTIFHPLDIAAYITLSTVMTTFVLGLTPAAAALTGLVAQLYSFFQHANLRTPRWLGYFIQRPEAHFVHHSRDVHAYNYADLPIWDVMFGTFKNPASFGSGEVGYEAPADGRYGAMLLFKDVSASIGTRGPTREENSDGALAAGAAPRG